MHSRRIKFPYRLLARWQHNACTGRKFAIFLATVASHTDRSRKPLKPSPLPLKAEKCTINAVASYCYSLLPSPRLQPTKVHPRKRAGSTHEDSKVREAKVESCMGCLCEGRMLGQLAANAAGRSALVYPTMTRSCACKHAHRKRPETQSPNDMSQV